LAGAKSQPRHLLGADLGNLQTHPASDQEKQAFIYHDISHAEHPVGCVHSVLNRAVPPTTDEGWPKVWPHSVGTATTFAAAGRLLLGAPISTLLHHKAIAAVVV